MRLYGADRIIMGTDYPFDMADYDPIGHVAGVDGFDAADDRRHCGRQREAVIGVVAIIPARIVTRALTFN